MEQNEKDFCWKGTSFYIPLKKEWNKNKFGMPWKKYASKRSVGSMVSLAEKWKPKSCEDFYNIYTGWGAHIETNDIRERGRTVEELIHIAERWQKDVGDYTIPLSEYFDAIILHTIVETYVGKDFENIAKQMLIENGFKVEHGTDEEDSEMNIDFKVLKDGELKCLIQVKPKSFIYGENAHTWEDRINAFEKHKKGNEKYPGIPYYYLIYDGKTLKWISNPNRNRCLFSYEELVLPNGYPVIEYKEFVKNQSETLFNNN